MSESTKATAGTFSASDTKQISIDDIMAALREFDHNHNEWIVVDPQGRMFKGSVEDMTQILLREHPLLKELT